MSGESQSVNGQVEPQGEPQALTPEQIAEKDAKIAELQARVAEVSKILVSPEYAEFLAAKAAGKPASRPAGAPSSAEIQALEEKLQGMTRAQFAAWIRDNVKQEVMEETKQQLWSPLMQAVISDKTQRDIQAAEKQYPDFWEHKEAMAKIAEANPSLNVQQVYHLAKANAPAKPNVRPPVKTPGGALPGGPQAAPKPKTNVTAQEALEEAYRLAGLE